MKVSLTNEEIEELVIKAQKNHSESFELLYEHFYEKLHRFVSFKVNGEEVEDLVSDTYLKIVQNFPKYKKQEKAHFSSWVFRIAHNTIIDHYRKKKEVLISGDEESDFNFFENIKDNNNTPEEQTEENINEERIREILAKLPEAQREILELKFLEDFDNVSIAQIMNKSEGNIRITQMRALQKLRDIIDISEWENEE